MFLQKSMVGEYFERIDDEVRQKATFVKTYILEAHVRDALEFARALEPTFLTVRQLSDPTLLRVQDEDDIYFFDTQNPRFVLMHSIEHADTVDSMFQKLARNADAPFDHAWLPRSLLLESRRGQMTGFRYKFDLGTGAVDFRSEHLQQLNVETGEILAESLPYKPSTRLRLQVEEDDRAEVEFQNLEQSGIFGGRRSLEQVQFRVSTESGSVVNTLYSYGKLVGHGSNAGNHLATAESVVDRYASTVRMIEDEFSIGWRRSGSAYTYGGSPLVVEIPDMVVVRELKEFVADIFQATSAFRMMAVPSRVSDKRIDLKAIDLHTGDPVSFEITRDWIRVYLPIGSCGNVVTRFLTNLQHHLSAEVRIADGNGSNVI